MQKKHYEVNYDGLVGPTHNYAGLSLGNIASTGHKATLSKPKEAALQGLKKMKALHDLGFKQGFFLPHERPHISTLKKLGFSGTPTQIIEKCAKQAPQLLSSISSASAMWTANAATVSPASDTHDGKTHFTAANLVNKFHRSIEAPFTSRLLQKIFSNEDFFQHHAPLPMHDQWGDEGAANHTRLARDYGSFGIGFFVYGKSVISDLQPKKFPARQTKEASEAISRAHQLKNAFFCQQKPETIDAGVFHNDVAAVGNCDLLFYHENAFLDSHSQLPALQKLFLTTTGAQLNLLEVPNKEVPLADAVQSYLFNSQLIRHPTTGQTLLIAPQECHTNTTVKTYLDAIVRSQPHLISAVHYFDLKESMQNGGGPACLRLRVVLSDEALKASHQFVLMNDERYLELVTWVNKYYRDRLAPSDLADPALYQESCAALDALTQITNLGSIYEFQNEI